MPSSELREEDAGLDPLQLFGCWYVEAEAAQLPKHDAMTLATVAPDGAPSARIVLLRGFDERGFRFFTNYLSRKARELADNARAALVFHWEELDRQIRIEGRVERLTAAESDAYFRGRPRGHQLAAWISAQSEVIPDRAYLEEQMQIMAARFPGEVPRPEFWGGYRVVPDLIEFWQGRENRLHDRLCYRRLPAGGWLRERLAP